MAAPNWANRTLFHADNLPILRGMNSESVDLIATDPPFNKGRDFHATPDSLAAGAKFQDRWSWEIDVHQDWVDQIRDDWPAVWEVIASARAAWGDDMGAFLCFMGVRLIAMHRVLKPTGSLYLHCDPTASHYLKALLDAIFGRRNFQNEFVWYYSGGGASKKRWARKHDILLFYAKTAQWTFHADAVRVPYKWTDGQRRADGSTRDYAKGKLPDDVLEQHGLMPWAKEHSGFPTQKPLALYERIIKASSNAGDVVLDPFAGCATTLVAAERLGRQWAGIDIWDGAAAIVQQRMADARQLLTDVPTLHYTADPPERTDDGETAAPFLRVKVRVSEPEGPRWTRAQMFAHLLEQHGCRCQGCDRPFDDPRYLQLDHNTPRADGGINHVSNRVLLCGPCNLLKAHRYTLSGLREQNRIHGYMAPERS